MFVIPFVFAFYPEILLIEAAVLDPAAARGSAEYLPGYDGQLHLAALMWVLLRLALALYLLASALAAFDRKSLSLIEILARLSLAALIMFKPVEIYAPAFLAGILWLAVHYLKNRQVVAAQTIS